MKRLVFILSVIIFSSANVFAQDGKDTTRHWDIGSITSFTINQTMLSHWAAGGQNSLAINGMSKIHANYKKGKALWSNSLDLGYGLLKQQDKPMRKTDDRIEFNSQYGFKAFENFYYTVLFNFKSQFTPGYQYTDNDSVKISNFLAPGYLVFSGGMNYEPNKHLGIYASFISGKVTLVMDPDLSAIGAFGVDSGKTVRYELGAYLKFNFSKEIIKNVTLNAKVDLFSNYLKNPQNVDVNADVFVAYKATKYLTINARIQSIYDDDIKILLDEQTGRRGPRLQTMEILGLGLTFKFPN